MQGKTSDTREISATDLNHMTLVAGVPLICKVEVNG